MRKIYIIAFFSLIASQAFSQGSIAGLVKDAKTGEAIIGANVVIQGTSIGAATDVEGNFVINNVKEGSYVLLVTSITYKTSTIPDVIVETAKRVTLTIPLAEEATELTEVVVTVGRQTDTDYELLRTIKDAKVIVVGITSEQISKTLDRDAAQVLRRVPGVTIKGDQFVQIRGLSERYNPVMLHNVYAPSVETDVRSFSFATLPSSQLDRMLVFKSPAADLPGDFAGGVVKVFTKSIPEENNLTVDYSTQYRAGTTFKDFYSQQKNSTFFTGIKSDFYSLPAGFPADVNAATASDIANAGKSLRNDWVGQKTTAIPDQRFTLTYSKKFKIGNVDIGNITALNYSNAFSTFDVTRSDYTTPSVTANTAYQDKQYNQQVRTGFLFNWAFRVNGNHVVEFKNLFNQSSNDQVVDRTGVLASAGEKNGGFDKIYRGIYSGQLLGTHDINNKKTTIEWVAGYNNANRNQPDYRRYKTNSGQILVPNGGVDPQQLGRFFADLNETAYSAAGSIKHRFVTNKELVNSPELKAGFYYETKSRDFSARNLGYKKSPQFNLDLTQPISQLFQSQNINNTTGLQLGEVTKKSDSYSASNKLFAYYLMGSLPFSNFKLDAGVRVENNHQILNGYNLSNQPANSDLDVTRILPSANLSYNFNEKMLVRTAYGETLNRPEFREIASFSFFDFNFNYLYQGTPGLKTAKIQNLDLRWEYYPSKGESVTFGGFYKNFTDPIETFVDVTNGGGGGTKNVFFDNAKTAEAYGVELEIKKSLSGLTGSAIIDNINVLVNATVISSTIQIPDKLATNGRSASRPLQGQAPYVFNSALFYANEQSGWSINLLHNVVGKTIVFVGGDGYTDVYLMPRNVIDLTFSKKISEHVQIKGGISDILNQPISFWQDGNKDGVFDNEKDSVKDPIVQQYSPGQVFSLGFSWRLR